jgi:hypothetical protein
MYIDSHSLEDKDMERKKAIKALRFSVIGLVSLTILLFILSIYTLFSGLAGAVSGDTFGLKLNKSVDNWTLVLNANPRNTGIISMRIFIQLGILDQQGNYIAKNSRSMNIEPGEQSPFSLNLTIPYEDVQKYHLEDEQNADAVFEMLFGIYTLGNLVGFSQTMRIAAGGATL